MGRWSWRSKSSRDDEVEQVAQEYREAAIKREEVWQRRVREVKRLRDLYAKDVNNLEQKHVLDFVVQILEDEEG